MFSKKLSHVRKLLGIILALSVLLGACQATPPATVEPTKEATQAPVVPTEEATELPEAGYKEAPMLTELVESGELPPVEERLPENPLVIPVTENVGKYGGVWHRGFLGPSD